MTDMVVREPNARLNVTINGQNGDLPDPVSFDATEGDIRQVAAEAIQTGYIPGIDADPNVDLTDPNLGAADIGDDTAERVHRIQPRQVLQDS